MGKQLLLWRYESDPRRFETGRDDVRELAWPGESKNGVETMLSSVFSGKRHSR